MTSKTLRSIKYPFSIRGGSVVTDADPSESIGSRVVFCIGSQTGERVMRANWGVEILNSVYAMGGDLDESITEGVEVAFQTWFPDLSLKDVTVTPDKHQRTPDSDLDQMTRVGVRAPDGTEMF
jgi:phage baseplate assembly protein W